MVGIKKAPRGSGRGEGEEGGVEGSLVGTQKMMVGMVVVVEGGKKRPSMTLVGVVSTHFRSPVAATGASA